MTTRLLDFSGSAGIALLVSAGIVYEIIAACCSSPQTVEINASMRADTLMKWVMLGEGQAALFVGLAALIDKKNRAPIIIGGILGGVMLHVQYAHAKTSGLANPHLPPTERIGGFG